MVNIKYQWKKSIIHVNHKNENKYIIEEYFYKNKRTNYNKYLTKTFYILDDAELMQYKNTLKINKIKYYDLLTSWKELNKMEKLSKIPNSNKLYIRITNILNSYLYEGYDVKSLYKDFSHMGCKSGIINELIYYTQTTKFYNRYKKEIKEVLNEIKSDFGNEYFYNLLEKNNCDLLNMDDISKCFLVYLTFEYVAYNIFSHNGIN